MSETLREQYPFVFELMDKLRADIALAEVVMHDDLERLKHYDDKEILRERYARFVMEVAPMRRQLDHLAMTMGALLPMPTIIVSAPSKPARDPA